MGKSEVIKIRVPTVLRQRMRVIEQKQEESLAVVARAALKRGIRMLETMEGVPAPKKGAA